MLKADFHIHTHEDTEDFWLVKYPAKKLIDLAVKQNFKVLAITNHKRVFYNEAINNYAKKKGILLIPSVELRLEGRDVLIINTSNEKLAGIKKLRDLEKIKDSSLIIAPHPYTIIGPCLRGKLVKHIKSFHAIEFSHFYTKLPIKLLFKFITGNSKAVEIAKKYHKPIVGTSDAHKLYEFGRTYTLVNSAKNTDDVINAVKHNRIKLVANPLPIHFFMRRLLGAFYREGLLERVVLRKSIKNKRKAALSKDLNNS
jgi:predicted metal-dependent phosphoesterase TrpH